MKYGDIYRANFLEKFGKYKEKVSELRLTDSYKIDVEAIARVCDISIKYVSEELSDSSISGSDIHRPIIPCASIPLSRILAKNIDAISIAAGSIPDRCIAGRRIASRTTVGRSSTERNDHERSIPDAIFFGNSTHGKDNTGLIFYYKSKKDDNKEISIYKFASEYMQRFTIARNIGYIVMDLSRISYKYTYKDAKYKEEMNKYINTIERVNNNVANRFASELIMPKYLVSNVLIDSIQEMGYSIDQDFDEYDIDELIVSSAKKIGVTDQAFSNRIKDLRVFVDARNQGIISQNV